MLKKLKTSCSLPLKSGNLINTLVFFTITLLILSSIVIITIISVTPIVMLAIGELQSGQRDIILTPRLDYLNATKLSEVGNVSAMPRHRAYMAVNSASNVVGWFMDFKLEKQNHLGTIGGDEPDNHSYIYAHESIGLVKGQQARISFLSQKLLNTMKNVIAEGRIHVASPQKEQIIEQIDKLNASRIGLEGRFEVKDSFNTAAGKFGIGQVNSYVYLDIRSAMQQMLNQTYRKANIDPDNSSLVKFVNSPLFDLGHFASEATVNFPNRVEIYSNPNYDETYQHLGKVGRELLEKAGIFSVETSMPIAGNLKNMGIIGMFIGVMFNLIIFSLFLLSTLMMNNMFRMGVERKNFDFALLKVMGADRAFVVANILAGALKYVALANLLAYPLAYAALYGVTTAFEGFFGYRHEISPTSDAVLGGLFIGMLVPVISAVAPIWRVIRNDLAENLNPLRSQVEGTRTEVYVEGREFPTGKVLFGLLAAGYGLMIYYLLPRALISQSLGLLLVIFFVILEGLLIGLILLAFSVQYLFERAVAYLCLFWVQATDLLLTLKNLSAHRFRNRRTALLYALSVSFIVFVSVGLQIQLQTIYTQMLKSKGSYIIIYADDPVFYSSLLYNIQGVEDWAFYSEHLQRYLQERGNLKSVLVSDKARLFFQPDQIRAVSPNLINTFFFEQVSYVKTQAVPPYDPYSNLYSENGLMTCTIGEYLAKRLGILQGNDHEFLVNIYLQEGLKRFKLRYTTVFNKRMGLKYSTLPIHSQIGVSFDTFKVLGSIPKDENVPIREIKVKISNISDVKNIAQQIRAINKNIHRVWDYSELKDTIDRIDNILTTVTYILLGMVLTISFFSLLTTAYLNVVGQTSEIAILLILGYSRSRITRIFVYENLVLVLNSCLIGLAVGYLVAQMMGLQREIFSELPISVEVRGVPLLLAMALLSSCLSTYKPLKEIFGLTVSQILNYSR